MKHHEELLLGEALVILLSQWHRLVAVLGCFVVGGAIYTFLLPPRWEARGTLVIPAQRTSSTQSIAQSLGIGYAGDSALGSYHKILESERVLEAVSLTTSISKRELKAHRMIEDDPKSNTITVSYSDASKPRAVEVVRDFIRNLRTVNTQLGLSQSSMKVAKIEKELSDQSIDLREAEQRLEQFYVRAKTSPILQGSGISSGGSIAFGLQYKDKLENLELQVKLLDTNLRQLDLKAFKSSALGVPDIPALGNWTSKLSELDRRLTEARSTYPENSPEVQSLIKARNATFKTGQEETSRYLAAVRDRVSNATALKDEDRTSTLAQVDTVKQLVEAAPREATQFQRLVRRVGTLSALVNQLSLQLEQAKIDDRLDPNRWQVLDLPEVSEDPINKNFLRNILLALISGLFIAVPVAWVPASSAYRQLVS